MATKKNQADNAGGFADPDRPDLGTAAEIHPMYTILAGGVGSFVRGDTVMAGDLGTAADITRLVDLGAIAPFQSADGGAAQADAAQTLADATPATPDRLQGGVPYLDNQTNPGAALGDPPEGGQPQPATDPTPQA